MLSYKIGGCIGAYQLIFSLFSMIQPFIFESIYLFVNTVGNLYFSIIKEYKRCFNNGNDFTPSFDNIWYIYFILKLFE